MARSTSAMIGSSGAEAMGGTNEGADAAGAATARDGRTASAGRLAKRPRAARRVDGLMVWAWSAIAILR
jgi:ABC-type proline/glycine betaine transport system substrate-binding protein